MKMTEENNIVLSFFLSGRVPSKKNSRPVHYSKKTGAPFSACSDDYKKWERKNLWLLPRSVKKPIRFCDVSLKFVRWDNRKWDLSNKAESVLDLLVSGGILEDDNYGVVRKLTLSIIDDEKAQEGGVWVSIHVLDQEFYAQAK